MENSSSGQVPHLYIYPLINPIAVGPHYTDRPLRFSCTMARQELSQTNVFHQTAVWAALHKGIEARRTARRSEGMCARVGSWKQSLEETNQKFSALPSCVKATGVSGVCCMS